MASAAVARPRARPPPARARPDAARGQLGRPALRADQDRHSRDGRWGVGYGRIGREVARLLAPWGMRVVVTQRTPVDEDGVSYVTLDSLLEAADVVVVACPLTEETSGLLDERRLGLLKPTAMLVNVARGAIVDQAALVDALRAGRLAGAGVDVVDPEPLPVDDPLLELPNVVGAHSLGYTDELIRGCVEGACAALLAVAAGRGRRTSSTMRARESALHRQARPLAPTNRRHDDRHERADPLAGTPSTPARHRRPACAHACAPRRPGVAPAGRDRPPLSPHRRYRARATRVRRRARRRLGHRPAVVSGLEVETPRTASASSSTPATHAAISTSLAGRSPATRPDGSRWSSTVRPTGARVQPHRALRPPPVARDGGIAGRGRRTASSRGAFPDLIGPQRIEDGVYHALFPAYDRLEVDLERGGASSSSSRRPLGDRGRRNWTDANFKTYSTPIGLGRRPARGRASACASGS